MVYENICRILEKKCMTINQLETKADIGPGVVSRWKEDYNPRMETLKKVADALGVSVSTLLREEKHKEG